MGKANSTVKGINSKPIILQNIEGFIECQEFNYMYYIFH